MNHMLLGVAITTLKSDINKFLRRHNLRMPRIWSFVKVPYSVTIPQGRIVGRCESIIQGLLMNHVIIYLLILNIPANINHY
jgi:hypothetical protein